MSTVIVSIWLLWMSLLDIRSRRVPMRIIGVGGILTLIAFGAENLAETMTQGNWEAYVWNMVCGILPGACLLLFGVLTKTVGYGDGAVLMFLGAGVGVQKSILVLAIGLFLAALGSAVLLVLKKANRNTCLPFLPFLSVGWFLLGIK